MKVGVCLLCAPSGRLPPGLITCSYLALALNTSNLNPETSDMSVSVGRTMASGIYECKRCGTSKQIKGGDKYV